MNVSTSASGRAGGSVRGTSWRLYGDAGRKALWAGLLLVAAAVVALRGAPAMGLLLAGYGTLIAVRARRLRDDAGRYRLGAIAEERVGALLGPLAGKDWLVEHDVAKRGGGNVDHVVHSPGVTFTIDTKRSGWHGRDLGQAHRHAEWAARHYGARRLIVPVICVQRSERRVEVIDGVYVVGAARLLGFLRERG